MNCWLYASKVISIWVKHSLPGRLCKAENQKAESQKAEVKRQKIKWQKNQKAGRTKGRKSVGRKSKGRNDRLDIMDDSLPITQELFRLNIFVFTARSLMLSAVLGNHTLVHHSQWPRPTHSPYFKVIQFLASVNFFYNKLSKMFMWHGASRDISATAELLVYHC